jgi:uncharacterized membrane protein YfcA
MEGLNSRQSDVLLSAPMNFAVWDALIVFGAAFLAGMVNSIAGGGTLISFPVLVWIGIDPIKANATNTVALWPGSVAGMFGLRSEIGNGRRLMILLGAPSVVGSLAGALLLLRTPSDTFALVVPFLILFATLLFAAQEALQRRLLPGSVEVGKPTLKWQLVACAFQFAVAVYGGYFGAGIGILMLAALGLLGLTNIHQMNGLKNFFAALINGVAAIYFVWSKAVSWPHALVMAAGAVAGGFGGAGLARRLGRRTVRRLVILVGAAMTLSLMLRYFGLLN